MNTVPSIADWQADPAGALAAGVALAKHTAADGDATSQSIATGIVAQILQAAVPLVGEALGGPMGGLAAAGVLVAATSIASSSSALQQGLTPAQQALVQQAIATGVSLVQAKLAPKTSPAPLPATKA